MEDRARDLARDRDASLPAAKAGEVLPLPTPAARKLTHSGNGGSGGSGNDGGHDDMLCETLIRNDCD